MLSALQQDTHHREPIWRNSRQPGLNAIDAQLRNWLFDRHSLTARLKQACAEQTFTVQIHNQTYRVAYPSETKLLGLSPRRVCFIREVHLLCGTTPVVFARTCIPIKALSGRFAQFTGLGRKPLGEVLFTDPQIQRGQVEVARVTPRHVLYARAMASISECTAIWGRRSLFMLPNAQQLLVNEIFLPSIQLLTAP